MVKVIYWGSKYKGSKFSLLIFDLEVTKPLLKMIYTPYS